MPSVHQIKLDAHLVSPALGELAAVAAGVKVPGSGGAVQRQDGAHVVLEDEAGVEAAGDEAAGLEEGFVEAGKVGG